MKVSNIKDIDKFFSVVDSCEGRVELVTGEGDRLNLKSKLSQYVSLANIFSGGEIPELEIVAYEKDDIDNTIHSADNNFFGSNIRPDEEKAISSLKKEGFVFYQKGE